jgi:adenylosuccinate synthase
MEHLYHKPLLDPKALFEQLMTYRVQIAPYVGDALTFVKNALAEGKEVLLEGLLGAMKDPDFGIYPFTTSSHTLAGFGCVGVGVAPGDITEVTAVTKAYSSAVGAGVFVSELFGEEAETLRHLGGDAGEYGATTGRPRRVGWFDTVATRYGCMVQGATQVVLTAIDVLGYLDEIKVCTGYEIDGKVTEVFPVPALLERAKPVYETLPGWKCNIRGTTDYAALPKAARDYVDFIETRIGAPIRIVSTGPKRHEITYRK